MNTTAYFAGFANSARLTRVDWLKTLTTQLQLCCVVPFAAEHASYIREITPPIRRRRRKANPTLIPKITQHKGKVSKSPQILWSTQLPSSPILQNIPIARFTSYLRRNQEKTGEATTLPRQDVAIRLALQIVTEAELRQENNKKKPSRGNHTGTHTTPYKATNAAV